MALYSTPQTDTRDNFCCQFDCASVRCPELFDCVALCLWTLRDLLIQPDQLIQLVRWLSSIKITHNRNRYATATLLVNILSISLHVPNTPLLLQEVQGDIPSVMWHNVNLPEEDTSHNEHLLRRSNPSNYGDHRHLLRNLDVGSLSYPLKFPESDAVCGDFRPRSGISLDLSTARIHP